MSSTKFVFFGLMGNKRWPPGLWLADTFSTSPLKPLNGIQLYLTGRKISMSSTKFVFWADRKKKQDDRPVNKGGTMYSGTRYVALWASYLHVCATFTIMSHSFGPFVFTKALSTCLFIVFSFLYSKRSLLFTNTAFYKYHILYRVTWKIVTRGNIVDRGGAQ